MLLYLVNPSNPLVSMSLSRGSYWNRFRLWKPLGLLALAGLTPPAGRYPSSTRTWRPSTTRPCRAPTLVGITAFTSQAPRAYEIAARFRARGVPVVMGGIHATMCLEEAEPARGLGRDRRGGVSLGRKCSRTCARGRLKTRYEGGQATMDQIVPARHDLLPARIRLRLHPDHPGLLAQLQLLQRHRVQRGPLSPAAHLRGGGGIQVHSRVAGAHRRRQSHRPQASAYRAGQGAVPRLGRGRHRQVVDRPDHRQLRRRRGAAHPGREGGLRGPVHRVRIGRRPRAFPSWARKSAMLSERDIPASVERIRRHGILVVGSFIMGLDSDRPGVGRLIAAGGRTGTGWTT